MAQGDGLTAASPSGPTEGSVRGHELRRSGEQMCKPVTIDDLDTVVASLVGLAELNVDRTDNHQTTALRPLRAATGADQLRVGDAGGQCHDHKLQGLLH